MAQNIVEVKNLQKWFILRGGFLDILRGRKTYVKAVDGVDFTIKEGEVLALVGESGCGKTTIGRLILNLTPKTGGKVIVNGVDLDSPQKDELKFRREIQIILQDPFGSLDPRMRVYDIIGESIYVHKLAKTKKEKHDLIIKSMETVNLVPVDDLITKYPNELSGGQMQRVAIARALVLDPKLLICDEPVSMLDASIQANILNFLLSVRDKLNLTMLFITHDLAVAKYVSDRIAVMYLGKIVETGTTDEIVTTPLHPYAKALFSAVRSPDPKITIQEISIKGEISDQIDIPTGCRFNPRCVLTESQGYPEICRTVEPELVEKQGHLTACHLVKDT